MLVFENSRYDTLPRRIGDFLRAKGESIKGIDVGANIGDTVWAFGCEDGDRYLAVEADACFASCLRRNCPSSAVVVCELFCADSDRLIEGTLVSSKGTARVVCGTQSRQAYSVDTLAAKHGFTDSNLLKSDTDGFDFAVINGAARLIKDVQPFVYVECDDFGDVKYGRNVDGMMRMFAESGYASVVIYDNVGYFVAQVSLADVDTMHDLLLYQLTSDQCYFDLLFVPPVYADEFIATERAFFASNGSKERSKPVALAMLGCQS